MAKKLPESLKTVAVIIFPYKGFKQGSRIEETFWLLLERVRNLLVRFPPVVVLSEDTRRNGGADAFLADPRRKRNRVDLRTTFAVDTCQMWIDGWYYAMGRYRKAKRIALLPGDIVTIRDRDHFLNQIDVLVTAGSNWDIAIGDISIPNRFGGKYLIDEYGTYPLLANWFPDQTRAILKKNISRPRSEFLNIKVKVLKKLLRFRKFAYEQTLNMLIRSWSPAGGDDARERGLHGRWKYRVHAFPLGDMQDDSTYRQYGGCLDQIERMERMIKQLWRTLYEPTGGRVKPVDYERYVDRYYLLDQRSAAIREGAMITIRSLLGL